MASLNPEYFKKNQRFRILLETLTIRYNPVLLNSLFRWDHSPMDHRDHSRPSSTTCFGSLSMKFAEKLFFCVDTKWSPPAAFHPDNLLQRAKPLWKKRVPRRELFSCRVLGHINDGQDYMYLRLPRACFVYKSFFCLFTNKHVWAWTAEVFAFRAFVVFWLLVSSWL